MSKPTDQSPPGWPANRPPHDESSDPGQSDAAADFDILDSFQRFNQRDDVFSRAWWDDAVHTEKVVSFYRSADDPAIRTADARSVQTTSMSKAGTWKRVPSLCR